MATVIPFQGETKLQGSICSRPKGSSLLIRTAKGKAQPTAGQGTKSSGPKLLA